MRLRIRPRPPEVQDPGLLIAVLFFVAAAAVATVIFLRWGVR